MPTRSEFQILSNRRLVEAKALQSVGHYGAAFYLAGYAVECGLKSAVCNTLQIDVFNLSTELHKGFKTHRLDHLIVLSGLSKKLVEDTTTDEELSFAANPFVRAPDRIANWESWSEEVRYNVADCNSAACNNFIDNVEIFLSWLKDRW